jgi:hypothetical protein
MVVAALLVIPAGLAWSDAIVRSQAMSATTIAQYSVEKSGVRLELEIGLSGLDDFKNLLPDDI